MSSKRHRLTDHEKDMQVLEALKPVAITALEAMRSWLSIPAVGIAAIDLLVTVADHNVREYGLDFISIKMALDTALIAAAVVPAAELAAKAIPVIGGLLGGSPSTLPPVTGMGK